MSLTNFLLIVIVAILVRQFFPEFAEAALLTAVAASALYGCYWLVARFPKQRKEQRAIREREKADEKEYWVYQQKHDAVREKYDPHQEWNEATPVPEEYLAEIRALNLEHQEMLRRRNGWTEADFRTSE